MECTGNGEPLAAEVQLSVDELLQRRVELNEQVIAGLREDPLAQKLYDACAEDAKLGRMSAPRRLVARDLQSFSLSARFPVVQGEKVRPVDDLSASMINPATAPTEKLKCDRLDDLHESMRDMAADAQSPLVLYKADIDAAYRRVCIEPDQMQFAAVVFRYKGEVWISVHYANPFGGVACVHNWDRIGKYIRARLHPFSGLASKSWQAAC